MKTILALVLCFWQIASQAQVSNVWRGGFPGQANEWNCPRNWSNYHIPDDFSRVVIPNVAAGSGSFPVIAEDAGQVNSLVLEAGATLTISPSGSLAVERGDSSVLLGTIFNRGRFEIAPLPATLKAVAPEAHQPGAKLKSVFASMLQVTVMLDDF